jgi:hypothetical protein
MPIPEHVPTLQHARVVTVHGYFCAKPGAEIGGVAGVVKISVRQDDEWKAHGLAE